MNRKQRNCISMILACSLGATMFGPSAAGSQPRAAVQSNPPGNPIGVLPEFRPVGAVGNNLRNPFLNPTPGSGELAIAPLGAAAINSALTQGPNPRTISNVIAGGMGSNGQNEQTTDPTASAWLYVFGQFTDHDLDLEEAQPTSPAINIIVPPGDPVFKPGTFIAMTRDTRTPSGGTIINTVAGYLDLSQLYGSTPDIAAFLRNADGTIKSSGNGRYLPIVNGVFVSGDPRLMENPELTALTILFMREHNFWVHALRAQHADWTGDQLYAMAKAINTAEYQNIVYQEYLPTLIGNVLGPYRGYDPRVPAQVTEEFSTAAFRVGHTQVSDTQAGIDNDEREVFAEPLAQAFFNTPAQDIANGIDPLLRSLGVDFSQATDVFTVAALRDLLFAPLVGGDIDQIDLIAIDVQRERDVGLSTLNQTRRAIGLQRYSSFAQLTADAAVQQLFANVYGSIDNVDLFMGGLAERHVSGGVVGPTFAAIIADQFQRLRSGDRFFWQNQRFDRNTAWTIANTTLATIMRRNTDSTRLQNNLFREASLPTHHKPRAAQPAMTRGNRPRPFLGDGV